MEKWIITRVETDEPIETYKGSFLQVMRYASKNFEDGDIDIEPYEIWFDRKRKER